VTNIDKISGLKERGWRKMHLKSFMIYTAHPVVLIPSTGSREGDFDGRGVVWIVSVYAVLVWGSE
jgi:hypothetical protein